MLSETLHWVDILHWYMKHGKSWKDAVDGYCLNLAYFQFSYEN